MKIAAFAKKFEVNVSTIRYYINNGLLIPEKKNGQYSFGEECSADMESILKFKSYDFSLEEIQLLFFMEKASRFKDDVVLNVCTEILKSKLGELEEKRDKLSSHIESLSHEINNMPVHVSAKETSWGVPFSFIPYLYCPKCQTPLKLDSASLSHGFIYEGRLWCDCKYEATIEKGLILCKGSSEESPFKAFDNVDSVLSMKDQFSANYRTLIKKAYLWMYNQVIDHSRIPKIILTGPFTFNFILEYMDKLGHCDTFVIFDPSVKRLEKMKQYLSNQPENIIYIAGDIASIPVKHNSVDVYIDDYSTTNMAFTYNTFSTEYISPLLKSKGAITGIFTGYKNAVKSLRNFKKDHPAFIPEKMSFQKLKYAWETSGVKPTAEKHVGITSSSEQHFPRHEGNEQIDVYAYLARK